MTPELHRPVAVDRIGPRGLDVTVEANAAECAALAGRLGLPAVRWLTCTFRVTWSPGGGLGATGHLRAEVVQVCVVSLDEFVAGVEEHFRLRFVPVGQEQSEIDPQDAEDEISYEGGLLDLGEAAAEQLALALDPFPRRPGAEMPEIEPDLAPHPFDRLRRN